MNQAILKWLQSLTAILTIAICLGACQPESRKRPYGYQRLGKVSSFSDLKSYQIDSHWLVLDHDKEGLSAMSILCSHDLEKLTKTDSSGHLEYYCPSCSSIFDTNGTVLRGPARTPLPHYKLRIEASSLNAPKDTLYVIVGDEVASDWHIKVAPSK